ncbi:hypothetical protein J7J84_05920 [bacterium]|nr:hypothetical protein [bacterium]
MVQRNNAKGQSLRATVTLPAWLDRLALKLGRLQGFRTRTQVLHEALLRYVKEAERELFDAAMDEMARDPDIQEDTKIIAREFAATESDGLGE